MKYMVVVPTYNERGNLEPLVERILALGDEFYVTIVDDNSPDGTGAIADALANARPRVHVIHREGKLGLGTAYITGFRYALGSGADYVLQMDADFSHSPEALPQFIDFMQYYDVVVGSRYLNGLRVVDWPLNRLFISLAANLYARWVTGLPLRDCTSGFKCFKREVLEKIVLDDVLANGYAFQVEMNFRALRMGYRIGELPITFFERSVGESKMSSHIATQAFTEILRMRISHMLRRGTFSRPGYHVRRRPDAGATPPPPTPPAHRSGHGVTDPASVQHRS